MVSLASLWLPILLSAVAVFVISAVLHTVLKYHNSDYRRLPNEDDVLRALAPLGIPQGEYLFPWPHGHGSMKDPVFLEKRTKGPAGILNAFAPGMPSMGALLGTWFVYLALVSLFVGYISSRALPLGADRGEIFRFATTIAFLSYGMAGPAESIWFGRAWSTTLKNLFDALLYAAATGAVFVWLWPR